MFETKWKTAGVTKKEMYEWEQQNKYGAEKKDETDWNTKKWLKDESRAKKKSRKLIETRLAMSEGGSRPPAGLWCLRTPENSWPETQNSAAVSWNWWREINISHTRVDLTQVWDSSPGGAESSSELISLNHPELWSFGEAPQSAANLRSGSSESPWWR